MKRRSLRPANDSEPHTEKTQRTGWIRLSKIVVSDIKAKPPPVSSQVYDSVSQSFATEALSPIEKPSPTPKPTSKVPLKSILKVSSKPISKVFDILENLDPNPTTMESGSDVAEVSSVDAAMTYKKPLRFSTWRDEKCRELETMHKTTGQGHEALSSDQPKDVVPEEPKQTNEVTVDQHSAHGDFEVLGYEVGVVVTFGAFVIVIMAVFWSSLQTYRWIIYHLNRNPLITITFTFILALVVMVLIAFEFKNHGFGRNGSPTPPSDGTATLQALELEEDAQGLNEVAEAIPGDDRVPGQW